MKHFNPLVLIALVALPLAAAAQEPTPPVSPPPPAAEGPGAEVVTIKLKDGSSLRARVVAEDEATLKVVTAGGLAMNLARDSVDRVLRNGENGPRPSDSNYSRLLFSATGRPLKKGEGYFSDHYVVFPGVAYGLTDNVSVAGGLSVVPGLGISDQIYYGSVRAGKQFSDRVAVSLGALAARGGESESETLGLGFVTATLGKPDKSLTVGAGVARTVTEEYYSEYVRGAWQGNYRNEASYTPVVMVGGTVRMSPRLALVSENWLILTEDFKLSEQPFALGVRFLGERLTADVGMVFVGEVIEEGFPIPWLSVTYHFGKSR
jgi:hypothetical protein